MYLFIYLLSKLDKFKFKVSMLVMPLISVWDLVRKDKF